jgi:GSH-dependent disulfide-bond oxidoreductase
MITLYGAPTPNTNKVAILLEELGQAYKIVQVDLAAGEQRQDWFLALNPNNKIPVITDDLAGATVWESGAILIHIAEHYDVEARFLPRSASARSAVLSHMFFQVASVGPTLGRLNEQMTAPSETRNPGMLALFYQEAERISGVFDLILTDGRPFLSGEYSLSDMMHYPWLKFGLERKFPAMISRPNVVAWLERIAERPAVASGMARFEQR